MDAAVAVLLCQGVSDPLRSGLGGGIFMLVYQRSSRTVLALDASVSVPARASRDMFQDDTTRQGRGRPLLRTKNSVAQKAYNGIPKQCEILVFLSER